MQTEMSAVCGTESPEQQGSVPGSTAFAWQNQFTTLALMTLEVTVSWPQGSHQLAVSCQSPSPSLKHILTMGYAVRGSISSTMHFTSLGYIYSHFLDCCSFFKKKIRKIPNIYKNSENSIINPHVSLTISSKSQRTAIFVSIHPSLPHPWVMEMPNIMNISKRYTLFKKYKNNTSSHLKGEQFLKIKYLICVQVFLIG